jgi:hypothetical protein
MLPRLTKHKIQVKFRSLHLCNYYAEVAELADALGSGLSEHCARVGSSPTFGTGTVPASILQGFLFPLRENCAWSKMDV